MNLYSAAIRDNGTKTDGFQNLTFKTYLISTKGEHDAQRKQICAPLLEKGRKFETKVLYINSSCCSMSEMVAVLVAKPI